MAPTSSRRAGAGAVIVIVLIIAALALARVKHVRITPAAGSGCLVRGHSFDVPLTAGQAEIAAIIAGVASHRSMPVRAVTIAYAAALQESKLQNLHYGDRDSVGVFQQRPSEGWGTRAQLLDPVYATSRFFSALAAVPRYQHLLIYQAAQAVQHSADGQAYGQYTGEGTAMANGFTGARPRDVWCWYGGGFHGHASIAAARQQLTKVFGRLDPSHARDPASRVRVRHSSSGWAVATWLVAHARSYHIHTVRYQGYQWSAAHGRKGWIRAGGKAGRPTAHRVVAFG